MPCNRIKDDDKEMIKHLRLSVFFMVIVTENNFELCASKGYYSPLCGKKLVFDQLLVKGLTSFVF